MDSVNKHTQVTDVGANPLPSAADQHVENGWRHFSGKEYFRAESEFRKALEVVPDDPDTLFALAMTQQANGQKQEAKQTFEKVIQLLENPGFDNPVRALMLVRLARAHISRMKTGDWGMDR